MSEKKSDVLQDMDKMSLDELFVYDRTAKISNRVVGFLGISISLAVVIYTTPIVVVASGIALYMLGKTSAGLSDLRFLLQERILKLDK